MVFLRQSSTVYILLKKSKAEISYSSLSLSLSIQSDWYDNEHAPARLTVPGFTNAIRYKATDSITPSWLAIYDLNSPSVAFSEPYKALAAKASDRERRLIPQLATLNRRIYESYSVKVNPQNPPNVLPGNFITVITMLVKPELEEEFNRWYEEEHMSDLGKVPGWYRGRRYKLISSVELANLGNNEKPTHNYLAIHEWANDTYPDTPEFAATLTNPWTTRILKEVTEVNGRGFVIHKEIQKPE